MIASESVSVRLCQNMKVSESYCSSMACGHVSAYSCLVSHSQPLTTTLALFVLPDWDPVSVLGEPVKLHARLGAGDHGRLFLPVRVEDVGLGAVVGHTAVVTGHLGRRRLQQQHQEQGGDKEQGAAPAAAGRPGHDHPGWRQESGPRRRERQRPAQCVAQLDCVTAICTRFKRSYVQVAKRSRR